jgi:hypothetical protein
MRIMLRDKNNNPTNIGGIVICFLVYKTVLKKSNLLKQFFKIAFNNNKRTFDKYFRYKTINN